MKAAYLVGPRKIDIREFPNPETPVDGVKMQVKACGICGSDLRRWKEGPPPGVEGIVPGHEASGIVVEAGSQVQKFREGDRIAIAPDIHCGKCYYCRRGMYNVCDDLRLIGITPGYPGAFAEYLILTNEILTNGIVHPMPEGLEFTAAALAEPACSVLATHRKLGDSLGATIVTLGAGPIGCLHVLLTKARGARAVVSQRSETRRKMVERFYPDLVINPLKEDVVARVREFTDGLGADVVVCANPVAETQTQAVEMVRRGGRVVLFGGLPKTCPMTTLDSNKIHYGEIEVAGDFSYHPSIHELALTLLKRKVIPAEQLITDTFPLEQVQQGFQQAAQGQGLKIMITM